MAKRSLILAGGGLKVCYQAGVLQVWLDEAGLTFDHADGASGGTFNLAGIAPHANIIAYDGCGDGAQGCSDAALLASINPAAVLPAGLFFGFLEAGALAMQREVGVPSSLVFVIQGLTIAFVLSAVGIGTQRLRM